MAAVENIEQLFCEEYKSLKSENKNLQNHNQQLKDELESLKADMKELLKNFPTTPNYLESCSVEFIAKLHSLSVRYYVFDNETLALLNELKVKKARKKDEQNS